MLYQLSPSPIGYLLMAEQSAGIGLSLLYIGDDPDSLLADAQTAFPDRHWQPTEHLTPYLKQICTALEQRQPQHRLTFNLSGTAFQQQVWQALQAIPYGKTLSYGQLAAQLGMPSAVRAVASACGANQVALLIPCHRVVRKNGDLSGYRWGVARKRKLLEMEAGAYRWAKENKKGIKAYNEFVAEHGLFGDEYKSF